MKKFSGFLFIPLLLIFYSCNAAQNTIYFKAMDTHMKLQSFGLKAKKVNSEAKKRIEEIETLISVTNPKSEIYKVNSNAGEYVEISPTTFYLINYVMDKAYSGDGSFNPVLYPVTKTWGFTTKEYTVPDSDYIKELLTHTDFTKVCTRVGRQNQEEVYIENGMGFDFGAVGKGFAGDEVIKLYKENGITSALLDLGGNIQALGSKPDGSYWKIGLKNPWGGNVVAGLEIKDSAVITSGGYERYFTGDDGNKYIHIFDGKTGKPVENNVVSSTIVTKSGLYGDYLSTNTFILGKDETVKLWKSSKDFEFIMMFDDHSICYSSGLVDRITLIEDFTKVDIIY